MRGLADQVARIAARQHGRITTTQLHEAGVDDDRIRRWVAQGRLHREHHGVYAVGIPITTVPRTLLDLAPTLTREQLTRACHEAWVHHRTTPEHIEACIARNPHKPGAAKLREAQSGDVLLSDLERRFVTLLRSHGLPLPRTNIDLAGDKVDCHWPALNVTIELHSYRCHATRHAFETDLARRRRSNHTPFSYGDVVERPRQTIAELRALLSATA